MIFFILQLYILCFPNHWDIYIPNQTSFQNLINHLFLLQMQFPPLRISHRGIKQAFPRLGRIFRCQRY